MSEAFSINRLYEQTGYDRRTIKKWLEDAGKMPIDGCYSLKDFCEAIENRFKKDEDAAALNRKTNLQADILEIEKAKLTLTVLDTEEIFRVLENRDIALRRVIITSELPDATKDKILNDLRSIDINDILAERSVSAGLAAPSQ